MKNQDLVLELPLLYCSTVSSSRVRSKEGFLVNLSLGIYFYWDLLELSGEIYKIEYFTLFFYVFSHPPSQNKMDIVGWGDRS